MRLNRLDLTRYGKFTDHVIDFGKAIDGKSDFHIIYGLNEAGKSTTLAAYLDLLFGMHQQTPYNFLHPYSTMRIGADLEIDGNSHELARLKQRTGSLIDAHGSPVNDALLAGAMGGISRDAYRTMFSLDDQSLKEGGNAIIQSKGELGELLFSASSGLAGLSKVLAGVAEEAASLYKKRSSTTRLAELKKAIESLKAERNEIDTFAAAYATLSTTFKQASSAYDAAAAEHATAKTRHANLTRILGTLPLALELERLTSAIEGQADLPQPPAEWFALLPQLLRDETRLQALLQEKSRTIEQLSRDIDAIEVDAKGLALSNHTEMLADGIARFRSAEADLPKRRQSLSEHNGALARLLVDLERPADEDPETLLLSASAIGIIRDLIERRSGVEAELNAANRELTRSRDSLERLTQTGSGQGEAAEPVGESTLSKLETAIANINRSDLPSRLLVEERNRAQMQRKLETRMAGLSPWSGNLADLSATPTADARQIEVWRGLSAAIERRIGDHRQRLRGLTSEAVSTKARIDGFNSGGSIDDAEANALRASRDRAWLQHLDALDRQTAQTFEEAMRRDDVLSATRQARAHELAELRQLSRRSTELDADIMRQQALLDEAETEQSELLDKITNGLPRNVTALGDPLECLAALESWSVMRAEALSLGAELQEIEDEISEIESELAALRNDLSAALVDTGHTDLDDMPLPDLTRAASDLAKRLQTEKTAKASHARAIQDLERDVLERERDSKTAKEAAETWQSEWEMALSGTWLADKGRAGGSVAAIREILLVVAKLSALLRERQEATHRIHAMERDQAAFRRAIEELQTMLGDADGAGEGGRPLLVTAKRLLDRHDAALQSQQIKSSRQRDLDRIMAERRDLQAEIAVHDARKAELTAYFGTDTLSAVADYLDQAKEREHTEKRISDLKSQIADNLRAGTFEAAQQALCEIDRDQVEQEEAELATRIDDLSERARDLYAEMTRAKDKLDAVGGDDAVARIEAKRRTILLQTEEEANRYLTLRTGTLAAEKALHLYRENHRSSMMKRASEAFRLITGGNYSGLATQFDKDKEILIGVSRDGSSKLAENMSTGTQFQLYLALRLAGYEEFASVRPAVPFIADDIMESFDNPRSQEVFRLLGDMSKVGQVIYLTHHRHLCEIAKEVVPEVQIHTLP